MDLDDGQLLTILVNKWWIMSSIVTKMNHWAEWKGTTWVADHHLTWRLLHKLIKINHLTSWFIYIHLIWSRFIQGWINDGGGWIHDVWMVDVCRCCLASQRDGHKWSDSITEISSDFQCLRINPAIQPHDTCQSWNLGKELRNKRIFRTVIGFKAVSFGFSKTILAGDDSTKVPTCTGGFTSLKFHS